LGKTQGGVKGDGFLSDVKSLKRQCKARKVLQESAGAKEKWKRFLVTLKEKSSEELSP
jgi:ribosomal protein L23